MILDTLYRGLTYDGSALHSAINYALLLVSLVPWLLRRGTPAWLACFALACAIQVILWFAVRATGVSVVWCAMAGFGLFHLHNKTVLAAVLLCAAGIVLYAFWFPMITTVAHLIAVGIGASVGLAGWAQSSALARAAAKPARSAPARSLRRSSR